MALWFALRFTTQALVMSEKMMCFSLFKMGRFVLPRYKTI